MTEEDYKNITIMNQKPVYIFAKWRVKEGELNVVLNLLSEVAIKSKTESGNLFYKVHQSNTDPDVIILFEGYEDDAAVAAHRSSEHFQALVIGKIVPLLAEREVVLASEIVWG